MKNRVSNLPLLRHWSNILVGMSLAIFGGFYVYETSAKTKTTENPTVQNLAVSKLAYEYSVGTFGNPAVGIVTANADGTGQVQISGGGFPIFHPSWSPNGTKIVYSLGGVDIYVMNADGSNRVNLTSSQVLGEGNPSWSITNKIAYERSNQIWVMNSDGTNQVQFPGISQSTSQTPKWSPNGSKLAFASIGSVWTINADGTNEQNIAFGKDPSWSPDGTKIIFSTGTGIAVINANGTNQTLLTNNPNDIEPDWSPDGTTIAYRRSSTSNGDGGIYVMNANGTNQVRILADTPGTSSNIRTNSHPRWQSISATRRGQFDFDGDGRSDISVFRPDSGVWYQLYSTGGFSAAQWGISTDVLTPADYDGDLKTDIAVWRASEGRFYILNSLSNTVRIEDLGLSGDIPTGGDWDGDGKADLAVFRGGAQGVFYYRGSLSNPNGNISSIPWGMIGDKPVASDYDGDGKTDAAIYRNGEWYVRQSSNGQLLSVSFGILSDKVVPADYDGDSKTDFAVYRDGIWYLLRSSQGFLAFQFGISSDVPAPADYDGDGKADAAVYRNGVWWTLNSQNSTAQAVSFGTTGDKPTPSAFVR